MTLLGRDVCLNLGDWLLYCTGCGIQRIKGAAYCHNCGWLLDSAVTNRGVAGPEQQMTSGTVPWGGKQVGLGILLVAISVIPVVAIAVLIESTFERYDEAIAAWVSVHVIGLAILAVVWRLGVYHRHRLMTALGLLPLGIPQGKTIFMAAGALVGSLVFTFVYAVVVDAIGADFLSPPDIEENSSIVFPGAAAILTIQALAVVTPITEEIFFRGFVFSGLVSRLGWGWALVVSAVVFSLSHLSVETLIPIFVTGLLLGWLYRQTGSLWPSIFAHAGQNALVVALAISGV